MLTRTCKILGKSVKSKRQEKGLSAGELAAKAGLTVARLENIEEGTEKPCPSLRIVDRIADVLETPITGLFGLLVNAGILETPEQILEHEEKVLQWEKNVTLRRMILPFFSVTRQTDDVAKYMRDNGCYNYSQAAAEFSSEQAERFQEIVAERRERTESRRYITWEIASSLEIVKFSEGVGEFSELGTKERRDQLEKIINIVRSQKAQEHIGVLQQPLYKMLGIYGEDFVTTRFRGIYLEVVNKEIGDLFYGYFDKLWEDVLMGDNLVKFLEEQKSKI